MQFRLLANVRNLIKQPRKSLSRCHGGKLIIRKEISSDLYSSTISLKDSRKGVSCYLERHETQRDGASSAFIISQKLWNIRTFVCLTVKPSLADTVYGHTPKRRKLRGIRQGNGKKEERLPSRKNCTENAEIKKLSPQLFHNSLDFRAGEQRGLCPPLQET